MQCLQIQDGIETHHKESIALAFHKLCLLQVCHCFQLTLMCSHLLELPQSQVKLFTLNILLHNRIALGIIR